MNKLALSVLATLALSIVPTMAMQLPAPHPQPQGGNHEACDGDLGYLKRVYPAQIEGVDQTTRVWVTELCSGFEGLRADGNANYLRPTIAQNDVLVAVLDSKAYGPDDVFAVQMMGDDTINLYVHHFGR
jgi:hypothetical protein